MFNDRITELLLTTYKNNTVHAGQDHEEALHGAIESATSPFRISDERKADLFARLERKWAEYPNGVPRRIFVKKIVSQWNIDHIRPPVNADS